MVARKTYQCYRRGTLKTKNHRAKIQRFNSMHQNIHNFQDYRYWILHFVHDLRSMKREEGGEI